MQWQELVSALSDETKYTRREVRSLLRTLSEIIVDNLSQGRDVQVLGLGWFLNVPAAPRSGRHPVTGERIPIPASRRVKFDPTDEVRAGVKASADLFIVESPEKRFGLSTTEEDHGKVRSPDRQGQGPPGKEGRSRG